MSLHEEVLIHQSSWWVYPIKPMKIYYPEHFKQNDGLSIVVGRPNETRPEQRHVGFLFRADEELPSYFLHLAWHCKLTCEAPPEKDYIAVEAGLDPINQTLLAAYCQVIAEANKNGQIPYGIHYEGTYFDPQTGEWLRGIKEDGLTCATFILAVYRAQGIDLLNLTEWPQRPEDIIWQEEILYLLACFSPKEHKDYVESQKTKIGSIRLRPEEVAAASSSSSSQLPVEFERCIHLAEQVKQALINYLLREPVDVEEEKIEGK